MHFMLVPETTLGPTTVRLFGNVRDERELEKNACSPMLVTPIIYSLLITVLTERVYSEIPSSIIIFSILLH